ncbi:hypothetical protein KY289_033073 [Solanum tuberosum]|nr:hypothetical protein KY289_033073 [Solanum tuberosum]
MDSNHGMQFGLVIVRLKVTLCLITLLSVKVVDLSSIIISKRYTALQAQLTFLFESRNILPPFPASNDGTDKEGDENDKSDKESEGDENGKSDKESEGDEE